jgi:zinc protease
VTRGAKRDGALGRGPAIKRPRATRGVPKLEIPIERFELSCGATLLVSHRPDAPVTAIQAHVRGGPALDPEGREGLAYLTGTLVDQGTERHSEEDLANLLEPAGGEVHGDAGGLGGTIVADQSGLLFELAAEMLTRPTYPVEQVARQKKRLLDRLLVERDEPRTQGGLLFRHLVYGDHWLGRATYGSIESVSRIDSRDLRAHHKKNWVARRGVLAVCGDLEPRAVKKELDLLLADWTPGTPLATRPPVLPPREVRVGTFPARRQQVHLYLGHLGIQRNHPDYATLVVMDHVLGTGPGFTNRISRKLRDELGLAYTVHASIHNSAGLLPGMFTAYIGTSPQHVRTAIDGFLREIRRIQEEEVGLEELELAKSYLIGSFPLGFERAARRASYMVSAEVHGLPPDNLERMLRHFASVTPADIRRVAREHLHPEASCVAAAGPVQRAELLSMLGPLSAAGRGGSTRAARSQR